MDDNWQAGDPEYLIWGKFWLKDATAQKLLHNAASEVNPLKNFLSASWMLPLLLLAGKPVASQEIADTFYQEWVEYRDGKISMAFNETPVELALDAIRVRLAQVEFRGKNSLLASVDLFQSEFRVAHQTPSTHLFRDLTQRRETFLQKVVDEAYVEMDKPAPVRRQRLA